MYTTHSIMEGNHYIVKAGAKRPRPDASPVECRGDFFHGLLRDGLQLLYVSEVLTHPAFRLEPRLLPIRNSGTKSTNSCRHRAKPRPVDDGNTFASA